MTARSGGVAYTERVSPTGARSASPHRSSRPVVTAQPATSKHSPHPILIYDKFDRPHGTARIGLVPATGRRSQEPPVDQAAITVTADDDELREAPRDANIPTLLLMLHQFSRDDRWLTEPFVPSRTVAMNNNDTVGFSDGLQQTVREAAFDFVTRWRDGQIDTPQPPRPEDIPAQLSVALGERVPEEYGVWDEDEQSWTVTLSHAGTAETVVATSIISCVGVLNRPAILAFEGADKFSGTMFHSSRWPQDLDIEGKRVAVIGIGATAMQLFPAIADEAQKVTVIQRSAQWVAPNANYLRSVPEGARLLIEQVPYYAAFYRLRLIWMFQDKLLATLHRDPE